MKIQEEVKLIPLITPRAIVPKDVEGKRIDDFIRELFNNNEIEVQDDDVLVITSKIVSFFEGGLIKLDDINPSRKARIIAKAFKKDARKVQILMETGKVVAVIPLKHTVKIPSLWNKMVKTSSDQEEMKSGYKSLNNSVFMIKAHAAYLDEGGMDNTNAPEGYITVLPKDPCAIAKIIKERIREEYKKDIGVIITDTISSTMRFGGQDIAIGYAGIDPITRTNFSKDLFGVPRSGGVDIVIDSIAGMAGLLIGQKTELTPAVILRGFNFAKEEDSSTGMNILEFPMKAGLIMGLFTIGSTIKFHIVNLFTFSRWPKRTRSIK